MGEAHRSNGSTHVLLRAAWPFLTLSVLFVAGASSTMLPAGLAFALAAVCVVSGSLRVLLVYRDLLLAPRPTKENRQMYDVAAIGIAAACFAFVYLILRVLDRV